jgi:hypothetical protein
VTTMTEEWRKYRDACYPQGASATQNRECHQAFFAGALCALKATEAICELPGDNALAEANKLWREVVEFNRHQSERMRARN